MPLATHHRAPRREWPERSARTGFSGPPAPVLKSYTISEEDVAGPFERQIPRPLEQMAKLHGLTYKSPLEELSEKFHMSENLLRTLNPGADFDRAGKTIMVADVEPMALGTQSKPYSRHANRSRPKRGHDSGRQACPRRYAPIQNMGS